MAKTNTIDKSEIVARFASPRALTGYQRIRALHREKAARAAVNGRDPRRTLTDEALQELFSSEELDVLVQAAATAAAERDARQEAVEQRRAIAAMAARIEREREQARRAEIQEEARRRVLELDRHG